LSYFSFLPSLTSCNVVVKLCLVFFLFVVWGLGVGEADGHKEKA